MPQHINPNGAFADNAPRRLPFFEESIPALPDGYGIEHSHDGGYYPYIINHADTRQITYLKNEQGCDVRYATREEAVGWAWERALAEGVDE